MGLKAGLSKPYARFQMRQRARWLKNPIATQEKILHYLIRKGIATKFGKAHNFSRIKTYEDFSREIPVRDYEEQKNYFDEVRSGNASVLWPGKPLYLSKTSGTTSGAKFIPITRASMPFHIRSAKHALLSYIHETAITSFVDGKMIFLQGSPKLKIENTLSVGRLSGIVAHHVPNYLQKNRLPKYETNCIEDWEKKIEAIVFETMNQDLRLISGIPSWVQMYFEKLLEISGKETVIEVFPNFSLFVFGGVNFQPYQQKFNSLIGAKIPSIELYPASEGFIAYQDSQSEEGMLLEINSGIFYEFIDASDFFKADRKRLHLGEVEIDINYVIIISTVAGLWAYNIGDTVRFASLSPHRIVVTGRIKHFTSAFGEHVIAEEVEKAMKNALEQSGGVVNEFHVAPEISPQNGLPYHEWFVDFEKEPPNIELFTDNLDRLMQSYNPYYRDLLEGKVLRPLRIRKVQNHSFIKVMKAEGKLGGQNKIPRLANDRKFAELLAQYLVD